MKKKIFALLLVVSMLLVNVNFVSASTNDSNRIGGTYINPLYADVISEDDLLEPEIEVSPQSTTFSETEYCTTVDELAAIFKEEMVNRNTSFTFGFRCDTYDNTEFNNFVKAALYKSMDHNGNSTEGDYLRFQYGGWKWTGNVASDDNYYYVTAYFTMTYYTTAEQEAEETTELNEVMSSLNLNGKSDYEKAKTIYDYITSNVTYDYTNLYDDSYMLKWSSYAALINGTAVCQGYSVLFYRMALEAGLDARIIAGTGNGVSHVWNIVKIGNKYYDLDSTWDASYADFGYGYFLKCDSNFTNHIRGTSLETIDESTGEKHYIYYTSDEFYAAYPMSETDYVDCGDSHTYEVYTTSATCLEDGIKTYRCTNCGKTYTESESALGHNYVTSTTVANATKKTNGSTVVKCSRCGDIQSNTTIYYPKTVNLSYSKVTYSGNSNKPKVTIKDSKGNVISNTYYTVSYTNNKNVGKATVKVTFKGKYTGYLTKTFTISPKATKISSLTKASKAFTVKWAKVSTQCTGYQIQYSTSSKFTSAKTVTVTSYKTTSKKISSLSSKKKYYVRVRTYKTVSGTKYYSSWSTAKNVTTK